MTVGLPVAFPLDWWCDVLVADGGGRDADGNYVPEEQWTVPGCLVGPRGTREPVERSDSDDTTAVLYTSARARFTVTSRVRVPDSHHMGGEWAVDGRPGWWPLGTEVNLRKIGGQS